MSECLKDNPIALRHCLLYEFLRMKTLKKGSVKYSYSKFGEIVGKDVIDYQDFQLWFRRFENGKFDEDDDKEPNPEIVTVLQNDKFALRACILYLFLYLQTNTLPVKSHPCDGVHHSFVVSDPIFHLYKKMRKVIGDFDMEYGDFDFCYQQFANGQFDLTYERDTNKKTLELSDMPVDLLKTALMPKLTFFERCSLRKVSKSLRDLSSSTKLIIDDLEISIYSECFRNVFNGYEVIHYRPDGIDCEITYNLGMRKAIVEGSNFQETAFKDLSAIFENQKTNLKKLGINFYSVNPSDHTNALVSLMKSFNPQIDIEFLKIDGGTKDLITSVLSHLKPGVLKTIELCGCRDLADVVSSVSELEQWKQAKEFNTRDITCFPIGKLLHFEKFKVRRNNLNNQDLSELKQILSKLPKIVTWAFTNCYQNDADRIVNYLHLEKYEEGVYRYSIPQSTDWFYFSFFWGTIVIS